VCEMCEFVANFAKKFVDGNSSEKEVHDILTKVCAILPGKYGANVSLLAYSMVPLLFLCNKNNIEMKSIRWHQKS